MNIEFLINILIIFFILASAFKRLNEMAKKAKELKESPPGPVPPVSDVSGTMEEAVPVPEEGEVWPERVPRGEPPLRRTLKELLEEPEPVPEETPSVVLPEWEETAGRVVTVEEPRPYEYPPAGTEESPGSIEPAEPAARSTRETAGETSAAGLRLRFDGSEVVRGIVMGEILGPPVSMR